MGNIILASVLVVIFGNLTSTSNCWHGIKPLRTTRAEVEKILGAPLPTSKAIDAARYQTDIGRVFVLYSTGPCNVQPSNGWNTPIGTVIRVSVEPTIKPTLASLSLDQNKFQKDQDGEMPEITYFTNEADGIGIEVDTVEGVVNNFRYFPTSKEAHLRCDASP
jgi:hypothetical protein